MTVEETDNVVVNSDPHDSTAGVLPPRVEEKRALEIAATISAQRIAATSTGRAQAAHALALARPDAKVMAWYVDAYQANLAESHAVRCLESSHTVNWTTARGNCSTPSMYSRKLV